MTAPRQADDTPVAAAWVNGPNSTAPLLLFPLQFAGLRPEHAHMISNQLTTGSSLSSYLDSLLEKARGSQAEKDAAASAGTGTSGAAKTRLQNSTQAALEAAGSSFKATTGQRALEARQ
eukprot:gene9073-12136_t